VSQRSAVSRVGDLESPRLVDAFDGVRAPT
jgi:hypothetical protein